jgi:hypothetical protein
MKTPFRFAISERVLLWLLISTLQTLNRSISRILYPDLIGMAIIHLGQSLPNGSSDLPGGRIPDESGFRAGSPFDASLFGLAPRGVCLAVHVTMHAGALLH